MTSFKDLSIEAIRQEVSDFAKERDWEQFHSIRNLLFAVISEVGEAADIVRWLGDSEDKIPDDRREDWADELADILILLSRLADRSGVDLGAAFEHKFKKVAEKYPKDAFYGSNRKYSDQ
jgi:NTP pyrophosphatase (non-canonical NTP hydrolase)